MTVSEFDVVGIGNALVDVLAECDDAMLQQLGLKKGGMELIDESRADAIYTAMGQSTAMSGGSAANTIAGLASLGAKVAFIGRVRNDALGKIFQHDMRQGVGAEFANIPQETGAATGRCLINVTPDAERTMATFLGAASDLSVADIDEAIVARGKILYLEGYLYDRDAAKQAFAHASDIAHRHGRKVALSLSDSFCVQRHHADFLALVRGHVDILFANESEICALYAPKTLDEAIEAVKADTELAVITLGAKGSLVVHHGQITRIAAEKIPAVIDTTGAGDAYAAGFLFGLSRGMDMASCGRVAAIAAGSVLGHYGARPLHPLQELLREKMPAATAPQPKP